jgi:predicted permease
MATLWHDIRYAWRGIRSAPAFVSTVIITAALGIAATTTIFSIVNAVLFTPPPGVVDPDRLVTLHRVGRDGSGFHAFSYPNYLDYRAAQNGMSNLTVWSSFPAALGATGEPVMLLGMYVSHDYFQTLGARPALGRLFIPADDATVGEGFVAVLSHRTWEQRFGADSTVIGRTITLNQHAFEVVGVAEEGFTGHTNLVETGIWVPVTTTTIAREQLGNRGTVFLEMLGRLEDGVSIDQARGAFDLISHHLAETYPAVNEGQGVDIREFAAVVSQVVGPMSAFAALLFGASTIILVIASVNVGGMLLARASRRGTEMAIRMALGAGRGRIIRQLLTESVILFLLGGTAGILITVYLTHTLNALQLPIPVPIIFDFSPDARVLAFSIAVSAVTGLAFGLAPALQITRTDLAITLRDSASEAPRRGRLRSAFVVAQVAGSTLLLIGAGLLARGLAQADAIDLGFHPDGLHVLATDLRVFSQTGEEAENFYDRLTERIAAVPNIETFGLIDVLPLSMSNQTTGFAIEGREPTEGVGRFPTDYASITPGYLPTMEIPIVRGRNFSEADRRGAPGVAIVNETVARRAWPNESAVGKRISFGSFTDGTDTEIIGVAADAKYRSLSDQDRNMVYVPAAQDPRTGYTVVARIEGEHGVTTTTLRDLVRDLEPELPLTLNTSYTQIMGLSLLPNRAATMFASLFGLAGTLLASVGLYGVLAYTVVARTREIGIRIALGAEHYTVRRLVLGDGLRLAGIGLLIGGVAAAGLTRLMRGLLYGVSPTDPLTFATIAAALISIATVASYFPARRATRTDPVKALRSE